MSDDEQEPVRLANINQFLHFMMRARSLEDNPSLITSLKGAGVLKTPRLEEAMMLIPRGEFIPPEERDEAYTDSPLPLSKWSFNVSAPHMYAICLEALDPQEGMSVLDIGSGCGLFTVLCAYLVGPEGSALGVEVRDDVVQFSRQNLAKFNQKHKMNLTCEFEARNCFIPDVLDRKFDRIHVGASCPVLKLKELVGLLNPCGVMVTPCGSEMLRLVKDLEGEGFQQKVLTQVRYGELIVPSKIEVHQALLEKERRIARTVKVPNSTFDKDRVSFQLNGEALREFVSRGFENRETSDVTFLLGNGEHKFYAHRSVVGKRSDHFSALFSSGMKDANSSAITIIPACEPANFREMLKFLYTDDVTLTPDNVVELLELATFYQVRRLTALCEYFLKGSVDLDNVCEILGVADHHDALQLKRYCQSYMIDNFAIIKKTEGFAQLSKELLIDVTTMACEQLKRATENDKKMEE